MGPAALGIWAAAMGGLGEAHDREFMMRVAGDGHGEPRAMFKSWLRDSAYASDVDEAWTTLVCHTLLPAARVLSIL